MGITHATQPPEDDVRRKVCILTSVHTPFDVRIFHKEAKSLAAAGYRITTIVPHSESQCVDGIEIRGVPLPRTRRERMTRTVWQIFRAALAEDADVYHFHDPELVPVGILLKLRGKRVVYDVHEDTPRDVQDKAWIAAWLRGFVGKAGELAEGFGASLFDGIVAATPAIARRFPKNKTLTVQNFPCLNEFWDPDAPRYPDRDPIIVYVGGISAGRGVTEMVEAMSLLSDSLGARLVLAGSFDPPELERELATMPGWKRVEFVGWLPRGGVRELLTKSRTGLVIFHAFPNHIEAQPNKLFEYMSAALPVIASDFPLWKEIVGATGCGLLVDPLDPRAIAEAMEWLLKHPQEAEEMGRRGAQAARARYNWRCEEKKLLELYRRLANGRPPR